MSDVICIPEATPELVGAAMRRVAKVFAKGDQTLEEALVKVMCSKTISESNRGTEGFGSSGKQYETI